MMYDGESNNRFSNFYFYFLFKTINVPSPKACSIHAYIQTHITYTTVCPKSKLSFDVVITTSHSFSYSLQGVEKDRNVDEKKTQISIERERAAHHPPTLYTPSTMITIIIVLIKKETIEKNYVERAGVP
jgi:hypothetical protein